MTIEKKPPKEDKNKEPKATLPGLNSAPKVMKGRKKNEDEKKPEESVEPEKIESKMPGKNLHINTEDETAEDTT